ncbi:aminoglycoside phosphotransferase family protein [Nocardia testacea]|uniref:aminoglycoside phosphotransferase family protein n=1 Tax=Nocardia testacea TaxID=248551 RepID=UPI003A842EE6
MLRAAKRIAAVIADVAPGVSGSHHEFPEGIRHGLDRVSDAERRPTTVGSANSSAERHPRDDGSARSEISAEEGRALYEQVRSREPDSSDTGNRISQVDTSAGPAVVRFELERPIVPPQMRWMPQRTAVDFARACGVRAPRILYTGTARSTGREFTIMQYVPGRTLGFDDPEMMNWLPDLLDQVQSMAARPLPAGMDLDIPTWQQRMIRHADANYHGLSPVQRSRPEQLGIGPLSDYVQPDLNRAGERTSFAHNDLYPPNLRLDEQQNLWLLDWDSAGPSDPLYNAGFFLERMGRNVDDATHAQATDMWLERIMPANCPVDTAAALGMYRDMEDWRALTMSSEAMRHAVSRDPSEFDGWVDWYDGLLARHPDWAVIPKDELRDLVRGWTEQADPSA